MPATIAQAEQHCANQSVHGPQFGVNECQMRCRIAYDIASDGTPDATKGWENARFRHPSRDPRLTPRGAFNHWVGGSAEHGHVTVSRFQLGHEPAGNAGADWSTDVTWSGGKGEGFFNSVDPSTIPQHWTSLHYVGYSWDLDGQVVAHDDGTPVPIRKHPHIKAAADATRLALSHKQNAARRTHLATALRELLRALGGKK